MFRDRQGCKRPYQSAPPVATTFLKATAPARAGASGVPEIRNGRCKMHIFPVRNYELKTKKTPEEIKDILRAVQREGLTFRQENVLFFTCSYSLEIKTFNNGFDIYYSFYYHLFENFPILPNITGVLFRTSDTMTTIQLTAKVPTFLKIVFLMMTIFVLFFGFIGLFARKDNMSLVFHSVYLILFLFILLSNYRSFMKNSDALKDKIKDLLFAIECENFFED